MKKIVYIDMDGVLADFAKGVGREFSGKPKEMYKKDFYLNLPVMQGAREAINALLLQDDLDLYIASKPTTRNTWSVKEKYDWIKLFFPELTKKIFLTCNKNLLKGDYLVDDHPEKWENFQGEVLSFDSKDPLRSWTTIVNRLLRR